MIGVKHPLDECNEMQEEMIAKLNKQDQPKHELMFSYGNAAYRYHYGAKSQNITEVDYEEWLEGLEEPMRTGMRKKGFQSCLGILSFTRYVQEKNDVGLDQYIKNLMGERDYKLYRQIIDQVK